MARRGLGQVDSDSKFGQVEFIKRHIQCSSQRFEEGLAQQQGRSTWDHVKEDREALSLDHTWHLDHTNGLVRVPIAIPKAHWGIAGDILYDRTLLFHQSSVSLESVFPDEAVATSRVHHSEPIIM